jgi:hypothetical protein
MLDQFLDATFVYPLVIILFLGCAELGGWFGRQFHRNKIRSEDLETLTVSTLGLLALLLGFTLSHALSRYEDRRSLVVAEANAIDSTAHLASMLPAQAQAAISSLLRDYIAVRIRNDKHSGPPARRLRVWSRYRIPSDFTRRPTTPVLIGFSVLRRPWKLMHRRGRHGLRLRFFRRPG